MHGAFVVFDVAGGSWNDPSGVAVDPAKVAVAAVAPSVDPMGVANTATFVRRAGLRAEYVAGSPGQLKVWLHEPIYAGMTQLTVSVEAGAITSGSDSNLAFAASAAVNNAIHAVPPAVGHLVGVTEGRTSLLVKHSVVRNPWRAEAAGMHQNGIAGVEWTVTKTGQSPVVTWQGSERRSLYQDIAVISNIQWAANNTESGGNGEGGLGVWPSPTHTPATDPTGPVTLTALIVPKLGGRSAARSVTWTIYSAEAGSYPERVIYLDTVAGSDSNNGLTAGAAKATLGAAMIAAGSVNGGATQQTAPVVAVIGGTSQAPRDIEVSTMPTAGSGNAIPGATDTYVVVRPAPGYAKDTIRMVNFLGSSSGISNRVRRLCFRGLICDIANSPDPATGFSSAAFFNSHAVYPADTNPQSVWLDDCEMTHRLGKTGNITANTSVSIFGTNFDRRHEIFMTRWYHHDTGLYGITSAASGCARDIRMIRYYKDTIKGVQGIFGFYADDNAVDPYALPVLSMTGSPVPGDIMTGVFSYPLQATVTEYVSTGSGAGVVKVAEGNVRQFKPDDAKDHTEVVVNVTQGAFIHRERVRNTANYGQYLECYRRDGTNTLRGEMSGGNFAPGATVEGVTSGARAAVVSTTVRTGNLFFSNSGVRGKASNPHPDGLQLQAFFPNQLYLKNISGSFNVGDTVRLQIVANAANTQNVVVASGAISAVDGNAISLGGNLNWSSGSTAPGAVTVTAGAGVGSSATLDWGKNINNDSNILVANGEMRMIDGQLLFGENGTGNVAIYNVLAIKASATAGHQSQFGGIPGLTIAHVTLPNQDFRLRDFREWLGLPGTTIKNMICRNAGTSYRAPGQPSGDNKGTPGKITRVHQIAPDGSLPAQAGLISNGAISWVSGLGADEGDDLTKQDFRPVGAPPAATAVAAEERLTAFDLRGGRYPAAAWPGALATAG